MQRRRLRHRLWRVVVRWQMTALIGALVVLVALWLTLHHKPGWYNPVTLDEPGIQRARKEAVATADYIGDRLYEGIPFDLVLVDRSVNEWLAALPTIWPEAKDVLPSELTGPAVRFEKGGIRVGSHLTANGWQAIVSAGLTIGLTADGTGVDISLHSVRGGSLPVPRTILADVLDPLLRHAREEHHAVNQPAEPLSAAMRGVHSVEELFGGVRIENRFVWFNGRWPFRIDSIRIEDGELRLRLEPL